MKENRLENLLPLTFSRLPFLKHLDLSYNLLSTINGSLFDSNSRLETLRLSDNRISLFSIDYNQHISLMYIDLAKNKLKTGIDFLGVSRNRNLTVDMRFNLLECDCEIIGWAYFNDLPRGFNNVLQKGCLWMFSRSEHIVNSMPKCGFHSTSQCSLIEQLIKSHSCSDFNEQGYILMIRNFSNVIAM